MAKENDIKTPTTAGARLVHSLFPCVNICTGVCVFVCTAAREEEEMAIKLQCHHHHRRHHQDDSMKRPKEKKTKLRLFYVEPQRKRDVSSNAGKGNYRKALIMPYALCYTVIFFSLSFRFSSASHSFRCRRSRCRCCCWRRCVVLGSLCSLDLTRTKNNQTRYKRLQNGDDDYCKQHVPCFNSHSHSISHTHSLTHCRTKNTTHTHSQYYLS